MNANLNLVILNGRLTDNANLQYTKEGKPVIKFTIAVNSYKKDDTSFFNCVYFANNDKIAQYLEKGKLIELTGNLHQDKWVDKTTGQNRTAVSVMVNNVFLLPTGEKKQENSQSGIVDPWQDTASKNVNNVNEVFGSPASKDDDIPF